MVLESIARRMTAAETTPAIGGRLVQSSDAFLVWIRGPLSMKGDDCGDAGAEATLASEIASLLDQRSFWLYESLGLISARSRMIFSVCGAT